MGGGKLARTHLGEFLEKEPLITDRVGREWEGRVQTLACPSCGAPIGHGDLSCGYCGVALAARAAEITVPALAQAQQTIPEMLERIKRNAYDGDAYYQLGLACYTLQLYDQAEDAFEQAKRFSPGSAAAYYFAGLAKLRRAEPEILSIQEFRIREIRKEFQTALSLSPHFAEAQVYDRLAEALLARNREEYANAIPPLESVTQALPKLGLAWKVLGTCYFQVGDYSKAIRASTQAFVLNPKDEDAAYLIGTAHARLGQDEETQDWARRMADLRGEPLEWPQVLREFNGHLE